MPVDQMSKKLKYVQFYLADKLYSLCGVEAEELDGATERLGIENDKEYINMT